MSVEWTGNKGVSGCPDHLFVDVEYIESRVLEERASRFAALETRHKTVSAVLEGRSREYARALADLERRKADLFLRRQHLVDSLAEGIPAELVRDDASRLTEAIARNDRDIKALMLSPPVPLQVTAKEIEMFLVNFQDVFAVGKPAQPKRLVRTFIHLLELDPRKQKARASSRADLCQPSLGVRRGT